MAKNETLRELLTEELKTKPICRFCLTQRGDELNNIYAKDAPVKSLLPLPVEIMSVASIEVFLNDGMPSTVCLKCRLTFDYCYRFKQMCKKAESLLNQVPLLGEWPAPLVKPCIPPELLMKPIITQNVHSTTVQEFKDNNRETQPKSQQSTNNVSSKATPSKARKILNSNPSDLPEPPIPTRTKPNKVTVTSNVLMKVENDEDISEDDIERLFAAQAAEPTTSGDTNEKEENKNFNTTITSPTTNATKNKPRVLNKYSVRILNKEADINVEPRLKHPRVRQDEDGNVSIVTEILDPNEPYETEPDPITNAEPVQTNVFPCPHCDRTFPLLQLREIHMVNHTRARNFPCTDCDRSFFSKYDLQKHNVIHTGERKYKCTVCDRGFTRPALLHRHEKLHTDMPKYICVYCEKQFLSKDDMEKHTEKHRKNRPFQCKVCLKSFAFKQGLERHEVVHSTEQPYPCQYCDKSFCTNSKLARHLVAHAGKRAFPCKFCHKSYILSHHLTRHLRTHKESVVMYSCNECEESFKSCEELVLHSTAHGTATLTCPLCQQNFKDVGSVEAHIKQHALSESYPCEFCDMLFLTSYEQVTHVKSAHAQDFAVYNEDENNKQNNEQTTTIDLAEDEELEEAIEDFLYDDTQQADNENLLTNKQETFYETANNHYQQQQQQHMEGAQQIYDEDEYLSENVEVNNLAKTTGAERLTDITIEQQEPIAKKSKLAVETNSKGTTIKIGNAVSLRRNPIQKNTESLLIERPSIRKSPRGLGGGVAAIEKRGTIATPTTKRNQIQPKFILNDIDSPTSTSQQKQSKTVQQTISQFVVKKENENNDYKAEAAAASSVAAPSKSHTMPNMSVDTETSPTGDKVVKMRLGDKQVRVQKIVVTKAQAAAMAKEGRICIKDGNLILTSKTAK